ncbi:hypothetical protein ACQPZF_11580 [Actinosynnema sp. CS-041913]
MTGHSGVGCVTGLLLVDQSGSDLRVVSSAGRETRSDAAVRAIARDT